MKVAARKAWLSKRWQARQGGEADRYREVLIKWYDSPHDIPLSLPGAIASDIAAL